MKLNHDLIFVNNEDMKDFLDECEAKREDIPAYIIAGAMEKVTGYMGIIYACDMFNITSLASDFKREYGE